MRPAARESVGATPPPKEQPPRKLSGQQDRAGWNGHSGKRFGRFCRNHRRGNSIQSLTGAHGGKLSGSRDRGGMATGRHRAASCRVNDGSAICAKMKKFRSEEHTSELQSLMRISYAVFCLKKKTAKTQITTTHN